MTVLISELVQSTTMSGFAAFSAFAALSWTRRPRRLPRPATSPISRPTFAASMSIAPTILKPGLPATCLTIAAPIGPRPKCNTRILGIAANYSAAVDGRMHRSPEMTALGAFRDGVGRVNRAPAVLLGVWLMTALSVLPIALAQTANPNPRPVRLVVDVQRDIGHRWLRELNRYTSGPGVDLGSTLGVALRHPIRFTSNLTAGMAGAGVPAAFLIQWLFIAGGTIDRYARDRPTRAHGFFAACGVFFFRFLRLGLVMAAAFLVVSRYLRQPVVSAVALASCRFVFDYAQVRAVVEDRRSMLGALRAALSFIRRNWMAAIVLYAVDCAVLAALVGVYVTVGPGPVGSAWSILPSQAYVLARLWITLIFWSSEAALFQGRLAHAGYVARRAPVWPDSAAA